MTIGEIRVQRLTAAEQSALADADPGAYDAYLIARAIEHELMQPDERRKVFGDYLAEAAVLNLRRNTSDEPRRSLLDRMIEAERARQMEVMATPAHAVKSEKLQQTGSNAVTLSALAEVRNPRQVAFVRQANIANGPQQVNNAARTPARARAGEVEAQQTELLEHRDAEWLDAGTASSSSTGYPALETMGAIDGATIPGGQSDFVAQRRQRRRMASDTRHA